MSCMYRLTRPVVFLAYFYGTFFDLVYGSIHCCMVVYDSAAFHMRFVFSNFVFRVRFGTGLPAINNLLLIILKVLENSLKTNL